MGWCTIQSHGSGGTTIRTLLGGETETCLTSRWNRNTSSEAIVVTYLHLSKLSLSSAQSLSHVWLFATPWTAAHQASLFITNSHSLPKLMSIVGDAIQPSHPLSSPSLSTFNLSQHQGLFKWVSSSHQVAKVLNSASTSKSQLQHQSFQWIFRTDFL